MLVYATLVAYEGASSLVLAPTGDIPAGRECGLYHEDTRFLSRYTLLLAGAEMLVLSARVLGTSLSIHFLTNPALPGLPRGSLVIRRAFRVGAGLHADLDVTNHGSAAVAFDLELRYDADFADIFEVKRQIEAQQPALSAEPAAATSVGKVALRLAREFSAGRRRAVEVRFSRRPQLEGRSARFAVRLEPGASFRLCQDVFTIASADFVEPEHVCTRSATHAQAAEGSRQAEPALPRLESDDRVLAEAFARAVRDLQALEVRALPAEPDEFHLAAGVPWFGALFGRDSLVVACQVAPFLPRLAQGILRSLARFQGQKADPETGEEPGKILHENRPRELAGARRLVGGFPDYGTVDATPLFVIAAHACWRTAGDLDVLRAIAPNVAAALRWIDAFGDRDGDGFVEYSAPSRGSGLRNQGWKDSDDAARFRDGRFAEPPIALVEVQGYVCEALRCAATLWRALGEDEAAALALERRAAALPAAIDRAFWMEERGFWGMALDGGKRCVDALTSNPGHLLWTGAALPERLARATAAFFAPELWSGYGVRTMGAREAAYSPIAYHNGSVWPFDNSLLAAGLARYGRRLEAARVCGAMLDAVERFSDRRLPELFCGFDRAETPFPVDHPTANKPQAWSAGAILLFARTMLGLDIDVPGRVVRLAPALPSRVGRVAIESVACGAARIDVAVWREGEGRTRAEARGLPEGYRLEVE